VIDAQHLIKFVSIFQFCFKEFVSTSHTVSHSTSLVRQSDGSLNPSNPSESLNIPESEALKGATGES